MTLHHPNKDDRPDRSTATRRPRPGGLALALVVLAAAVASVMAGWPAAPAQRSGSTTAQSKPGPKSNPKSNIPLRIDLKHILEGQINRRGELVGLHHAPSAPETMRVEGRPCRVVIRWTSPGTDDDVRTAQVELRDRETGRVVREKFSTFYPSAWTPQEIEAAIREAYADAQARRQVRSHGRWEGRTRNGQRISGYLSDDGTFITTAFPIRDDPPRRADARSSRKQTPQSPTRPGGD